MEPELWTLDLDPGPWTQDYRIWTLDPVRIATKHQEYYHICVLQRCVREMMLQHHILEIIVVCQALFVADLSIPFRFSAMFKSAYSRRSQFLEIIHTQAP